ncbi:MAG: Mur ligase family protein [Gemmatimonadaceae bacterium]|nr:Mur ligase family protein [Gemmatimonadaceae bacterium]
MSTTRPGVASTIAYEVTGRHFWTMDRVADALAGVAAGALPRGPRELVGVETDTRTIRTGTLFVALRGERFDAHDFLADAVRAGAQALVVDDPARAAGLGVAIYVVTDTRAALGALGYFRRRAWGRPVIAVGGSNGKTSTKELLAAALGGAYRVHATTGNLNNEIGVPQTLLSLPDEADLAVVEAGTNAPGEIARLRRIIAPDVTVITSIGEEHLEGLGDLAGVLREELDLVDDVDVVVAPSAHPEIARGAEGRARRVVVAGLEAGELRPRRHALDADGTGRLWFAADDGEVGPWEAIVAGLARMPQPSMRAAVQPLGRALLVNDAYNANPPSARAALDLLQAVGDGRPLVAVLGSMRELGAASDAMHDAILLDALGRPLAAIAAIGEFAHAARRVAPTDPRVLRADDAPDVVPALLSTLAPDSAILLKGSRGARLERLVDPLTAWASAG